MKFNTITRTAMAAATSLALGLGTIACSRDYVAAYVYSVSNATGLVNAYAVDYQSGVLTQISGSPFNSNLTNPSTLVAAPNGKTIYVIGGSQNPNVSVMTVGSDGKLYAQAEPNLAANGTYPTAAAIDSTGSYLYVTYTYQDGFTPVAVGPGGVSIFKINSDGSLGTPTNVNVGNNPTAIAVSVPTCTSTPVIPGNAACTGGGTPNVFVYVTDAENSIYSPGAVPTVLGFAQNTSTGALTLLSGTTYNPTLKTYQGVSAGTAPSAITVDPTGRYAYITDRLANQAYGYSIATTTSGNLTPLVTNPIATGLYPVSITFEPRGLYAYIANQNSNTVSSYTLNQSNGSLGGSAGATFTTATSPSCVTVEPALGIYLYTSNYLDNSISGGQLSPETGVISGVANSPFPTGSQPTCAVTVPNGAHATQLVTQ